MLEFVFDDRVGGYRVIKDGKQVCGIVKCSGVWVCEYPPGKSKFYADQIADKLDELNGVNMTNKVKGCWRLKQ